MVLPDPYPCHRLFSYIRITMVTNVCDDDDDDDKNNNDDDNGHDIIAVSIVKPTLVSLCNIGIPGMCVCVCMHIFMSISGMCERERASLCIYMHTSLVCLHVKDICARACVYSTSTDRVDIVSNPRNQDSNSRPKVDLLNVVCVMTDKGVLDRDDH